MILGVPVHLTHEHFLGGWDPLTCVIPTSIPAEVEQAFSNVDLAVKHAGGKGWEQVYSVRLYVTEMSEEMSRECVSAMKKWCPGHQPLWTWLGVKELALPGMRVEVEVVADLGDAVEPQK